MFVTIDAYLHFGHSKGAGNGALIVEKKRHGFSNCAEHLATTAKDESCRRLERAWSFEIICRKIKEKLARRDFEPAQDCLASFARECKYTGCLVTRVILQGRIKLRRRSEICIKHVESTTRHPKYYPFRNWKKDLP